MVRTPRWASTVGRSRCPFFLVYGHFIILRPFTPPGRTCAGWRCVSAYSIDERSGDSVDILGDPLAACAGSPLSVVRNPGGVSHSPDCCPQRDASVSSRWSAPCGFRTKLCCTWWVSLYYHNIFFRRLTSLSQPPHPCLDRRCKSILCASWTPWICYGPYSS